MNSIDQYKCRKGQKVRNVLVQLNMLKQHTWEHRLVKFKTKASRP